VSRRDRVLIDLAAMYRAACAAYLQLVQPSLTPEAVMLPEPEGWTGARISALAFGLGFVLMIGVYAVRWPWRPRRR
jgi:hypothetical protein